MGTIVALLLAAGIGVATPSTPAVGPCVIVNAGHYGYSVNGYSHVLTCADGTEEMA